MVLYLCKYVRLGALLASRKVYTSYGQKSHAASLWHQEAGQSLLAAHVAIAGADPLLSCWKEQNISFTLMVSLSMALLGERRYHSPQGRLAEPRQVFLFFDGTYLSAKFPMSSRSRSASKGR